MVQVIVVVESEVDGPFPSICSEQAQQLAALKQAIAAHPPAIASAVEVTVLTAAQADQPANLALSEDQILCPLTLLLPEHWQFPGREVYQACQNIPGLRQWVAQTLNAPIGEGSLWLPIVLTARGPLYAEVIGTTLPSSLISAPSEKQSASPHPRSFGEASYIASSPLSYFQPIHLSDRWRQPLYRLGQLLLRSLAAPPAVYLLQFGVDQGQICFDRLFPFPAVPALASLEVQTPDLFACHWRCLTGQPILDLAVAGSADYRSLEG